ncbi:MAG: hypothetical protein ACR2QW_11435 [bacterium]
MEDAGVHIVLVYLKTPSGFVRHQTFNQVGARPYGVVFDDVARKFYAWGSLPQKMIEFDKEGDQLTVK